MKLAQTSRLEVKVKSSLLSRKISLLVFSLVFVMVSSIDTLKVSKDELTGEITFNKLQLVANAGIKPQRPGKSPRSGSLRSGCKGKVCNKDSAGTRKPSTSTQKRLKRGT